MSQFGTIRHTELAIPFSASCGLVPSRLHVGDPYEGVYVYWESNR